ncbi:hypothetical protein MY10362_006118 [Beauveria mimosiformis]
MSWRYPLERGIFRPESNWGFMVVVKDYDVYCPLAILNEMPPTDDDWTWVHKLWVADTACHMYEFLANKDPEARCKLQAEIDLALERHQQTRLWFRVNEKAIGDEPNLVEETQRQRKLKDPVSICHPYITLGMKKCIFRQVPPGNGNETFFEESAFWTQDSVKTTFGESSKFSIVVFDVTDPNNVALAVIDHPPGCRRRVATMEQHCESEIHEFKDDYLPVIEALAKIPHIKDEDILQLVWDSKTLRAWARSYKYSRPYKPQSDRLLDDEICRALKTDKDASAVYNLSLAKATRLTLVQLVNGLSIWPASPAVGTLSFPDRLLTEGSVDQRDKLIDVLANMHKLEAVYITDVPQVPTSWGKMADSLVRGARAQAEFFELALRTNRALWKKVHGSSMLSWQLSPRLKNIMNKEHAEILKEHVDAHYA